MKNYNETIEICKDFYSDCLRFWQREQHPQAEIKAIKDVERLTTNPFSPNGELLNQDAVKDFCKTPSI